ncbi:MAG TPA: DUF72 domain-containing protein [Ilumatobacteraceae bacterium]|nr:DUF72 domain-containing protein [Ilumatobacteraceae bacterium]
MAQPTLHVGCPMWAQRAWVGRFLPADTAAGGELSAYSRLLNAVEGNTTFYAAPTPATVARWREQALPGFRFVFKVPKRITHERRLRGVDAELTAFCRLMAPLGELIGGFTLQLPPSFGPDDMAALENALRQRPAAWRWSVEVRHPAFFTGAGRLALDAMLRRFDVERVLLDTEPLFERPPTTDDGREEWEQKPRLPALHEPITAQPIVRIIGNDDPTVTAAGVAVWTPIVAQWLRHGRTPTVFLHTPDNSGTPALALAFHAAVGQLVHDLQPLPSPPPLSSKAQGSLF